MIVKIYDKTISSFTNAQPKNIYTNCFVDINHNQVLNGEETFEFTIPFVKFVDTDIEDYVEYNGQYFIIKEIHEQNTESGRIVLIMAVGVYQMLLDKIITLEDGDTWLPGKTLYEVLSRIVQGTPFTIGTVDDFGTWDIELHEKNALEAINEAMENWKGATIETVVPTPPAPVTDLTATITNNVAYLKWSDPNDSDWSGTKIVRNNARVPTSQTDGFIVEDVKVRNKYKYSALTDNTLSASQTYYYKCFPYDIEGSHVGNSNSTSVTTSNIVTDTIAPATVTSFTAIINASKQVELKWTDPTDADWVSTIVCRKLNSYPVDENDGQILKLFSKNTYAITAYVDTNVTVGLSYYYRIFTKDTSGNVNTTLSGMTKNVTIPVGAITTGTVSSLAATYSSGKNNITYTDPADDNWARTTVVRKASSAPTSETDGTTVVTSIVKNQYSSTPFQDTSIQNSTTYYYRAFTKDILGNVNTDPVQQSVAVPSNAVTYPTAIVNLNVTVLNGKVSITWTDPGDATWAGTKLLRKLGSAPTSEFDGYVVVDEKTKNVYLSNPFVETLSTGTYYYKAFDYNTSGLYTAGNTAIATVNASTPPNAVTSFTATANINDVYVSWTDPNNTDWSGTKVIRKTGGSPANENDGILVIDSIIKNEFSITPFVDRNLQQGYTYYYKAFPYNTIRLYNTGSATVSVNVTDTIAPNNVTGLLITQEGSTLKFTWTDPSSSDWAGTRLVYKANSAPTNKDDGTLIADSKIKNPSIIFNAISFQPGVTYYFKCFPYDLAGNFNNTSPANSLTFNDTFAPALVNDFKVLKTTGNEVEITWTDPNDNDWFQTIIRKKKNGAPIDINDGIFVVSNTTRDQYKTTPFTDDTNDYNSTYYYKAFSVDNSNNINNDNIEVIITIGAKEFAASASNMTSVQESQGIKLNWTDPNDAEWAGTKILKNTMHFPLNENDGETVVYSTTRNAYMFAGYYDTYFEKGETYYYAAYCVNDEGIYTKTPATTMIVAKDINAPAAIMDLRLSPQAGNKVQVSWSDPEDVDWLGTKLVRKKDAIPADENDGIILIDIKNRNRFDQDYFEDSGLLDSTIYYYKVFPYDNDGNVNIDSRSVMFQTNDLTPPAVATAFSAQQAYSDQAESIIGLKWTDPDDADWYSTMVYMKENSAPTTSDILVAFSTTKNKYKDVPFYIGGTSVVLDLWPDKTYYFKAFTKDISGNINDTGSAISVTTVGTDAINPSSISAQRFEASIKVWCDDPEGVWDGTVIVKKVGSAPTSHTDGTVIDDYTLRDKYTAASPYIDTVISDNTTYYYTPFPYVLNGGNRLYNVSSNVVSVAISDLTPPVVAPLTANRVNGTVVLTWVNPMEPDYQSTRLVKNTSHEPANETDGITLVESNISPTYTDSAVVAGQLYYYKTFTRDTNGNWNRTGTAKSILMPVSDDIDLVTNVRIINSPSNPTTLICDSNSLGGIWVKWTDPDYAYWKETKVLVKYDGEPLSHIDGQAFIFTTKNQYQNTWVNVTPNNWNVNKIAYVKIIPYDIYNNYNFDFAATQVIGTSYIKPAVPAYSFGTFVYNTQPNKLTLRILTDGLFTNPIPSADKCLRILRRKNEPGIPTITGFGDTTNGAVVYDGIFTNNYTFSTTNDGIEIIDTPTLGFEYEYVVWAYYHNPYYSEQVVISNSNSKTGIPTDDVNPTLIGSRGATGVELRLLEPYSYVSNLIIVRNTNHMPTYIDNRTGVQSPYLDDGTRIFMATNVGETSGVALYKITDADVTPGTTYRYKAFGTTSVVNPNDNKVSGTESEFTITW